MARIHPNNDLFIVYFYRDPTHRIDGMISLRGPLVVVFKCAPKIAALTVIQSLQESHMTYE